MTNEIMTHTLIIVIITSNTALVHTVCMPVHIGTFFHVFTECILTKSYEAENVILSLSCNGQRLQ